MQPTEPVNNPQSGAIPFTSCWLTVYTELGRRLAHALNSSEGLTPTQYRALLELSASGGTLRPSDLSELLILKPSSVTCALNGLDQRELIEREIAQGDRRSVQVTLLPAGAEALSRASDALAHVLDDAWSELDTSQRNLVIESTRYAATALAGRTSVPMGTLIQPFYVTTLVVVNQVWSDLIQKECGLTMARVPLGLLGVSQYRRGGDHRAPRQHGASLKERTAINLHRFSPLVERMGCARRGPRARPQR